MDKKQMLESITQILSVAINQAENTNTGKPHICRAHFTGPRIIICHGVDCCDCPFSPNNHKEAKEYLTEISNLIKLEESIK